MRKKITATGNDATIIENIIVSFIHIYNSNNESITIIIILIIYNVLFCTQFMLTYKRPNDVNESNVPGGIFLILLLCKNLFIKYKT